MGTFALILGLIGGLCAIMGILDAAEVVPPLGAAFTVEFWMMLAGVLLLACIAISVNHTEYE